MEKRRKGDVSWKAVAVAARAAIVPVIEKRILRIEVEDDKFNRKMKLDAMRR